jgi:5'-phosphate synthase pdxT subunit
MKVGVLALQGDFREHCVALESLGVNVSEVRLPEQLDGLDGLVIPGGESTTIGRLMRLYEFDEAFSGFEGALFGTCAGMIVLARDSIDGVDGQLHLGAIDVTVRRNGYGRQVASFESPVELADGTQVPGVFIRAPRIVEHGANVELLAHLDDEPVLVREGRVLAASFHPELADDRRIHSLFLEIVEENGGPSLRGCATS